MSRRMRATQAAQRRHQQGVVPQPGLLRRRPAAVGVGLAWVIFSVCMAWWLGSPYLKSAPENLDALDVARVSKVVQFSSESGEPVSGRAPSAARNTQVETNAVEGVDSAEDFVAQWATAHPGLVMTLGGALIILSLVTAGWALRQLWLVERERQVGGGGAIEGYRVAPSMVVRAEDRSVSERSAPTLKQSQAKAARVRKPKPSDSRGAERASIPVPRAEPPKLHLVQTRSDIEPPMVAMRNGKRRRPDFDRIVSEMAMAQTALSRVDAEDGGREGEDSDKSAA